MVLFELILAGNLLFEHAIQVCVRYSQFSLHLFDYVMKGVFRGIN